MNMLIPRVSDRFRLLAPFSLDANYNQWLIQNLGTNVIPEGTIISVDSFKINKVTRKDARIAFIIRVTPGSAEHTMVRYGGTNSYGHRIQLTLDQIENLNVERIEMP